MPMKAFLLMLLAATALGCLGGGGGPPAGNYSVPQLKYLLLDHYGESQFFYCDPDYYPIGRGDEAVKAVEAFPAIQNDTDSFSAITARLGLHAPFSNDSMLAIYREYKKLNAVYLVQSGDSYFYSMQLGNETQGRRVNGTITRSGAITETGSEKAFLTCPICLATGTLISTPGGDLRVEDLRPGMLVWTQDSSGARISAPLLSVSRTPVPPTHEVVHLVLSDGRELYASPGHPTTDGRKVGDLRAGDALDGSLVVRADLVPYADGYTYDILPDGDSGIYWADGIPLESTLAEKN